MAHPSVGDSEQVLRVGCTGLTTQEAYVVLRPEASIWLAWLGLGSCLLAVTNPAGPKRDKEGKVATRRGPRGIRIPKGTKSFRTYEEAFSAAHALWQQRLAQRIAEIRELRGGLDWGISVAPLEAPIVIKLEPNENAWDRAIALPRIASTGVCIFSGLRSSGECA